MRILLFCHRIILVILSSLLCRICWIIFAVITRLWNKECLLCISEINRVLRVRICIFCFSKLILGLSLILFMCYFVLVHSALIAFSIPYAIFLISYQVHFGAVDVYSIFLPLLFSCLNCQALRDHPMIF